MSIKVPYTLFSSAALQMAMQKLENCATDGRSAYMIRLMGKELKDVRKTVSDEYKAEVMEKFMPPPAEGTARTEKDYEEFQPPEDEAKLKEFEAAVEVFEKREATLSRPKLTAHDIRDAKLTAREQEALEPILDDSGFASMPAPKPGQTPVRLAK